MPLPRSGGERGATIASHFMAAVSCDSKMAAPMQRRAKRSRISELNKKDGMKPLAGVCSASSDATGVHHHSDAITVPKCLPYCAALYFKIENLHHQCAEKYISSMLKLYAKASLYATVL
ncbi:hypothetical protein ISCGN_013046 [Ixodes scapularis]